MSRICVIGGANADITAITFGDFVAGDSNPGTVRLTPGGVARNIAHNLALLGNEVVFLTRFGDGAFGQFTADSCLQAGIDIRLCDTAPEGTRSCFLSINNRDGEMVGGVADMTAADHITPEWLATKLQQVGNVDAFVADANIPTDSLAYLIDHANAPLYVDAVSGAKAPKIIEALTCTKKRYIFALKCNQLEYNILKEIKGVERWFVSRGSEGLDVLMDGRTRHFPALPCRVVNTTGSGDALMAGLAHAGPSASIEEAVRVGLLCAKITVECADTVNKQLKERYEQLS